MPQLREERPGLVDSPSNSALCPPRSALCSTSSSPSGPARAGSPVDSPTNFRPPPSALCPLHHARRAHNAPLYFGSGTRMSMPVAQGMTRNISSVMTIAAVMSSRMPLRAIAFTRTSPVA